VWTGFLVLAIPQIPLSLGNSILATRQVAADLFPHRPLTVRRIGLTYSVMNLVNCRDRCPAPAAPVVSRSRSSTPDTRFSVA
jgi:hypothetical protein